LSRTIAGTNASRSAMSSSLAGFASASTASAALRTAFSSGVSPAFSSPSAL